MRRRWDRAAAACLCAPAADVHLVFSRRCLRCVLSLLYFTLSLNLVFLDAPWLLLSSLELCFKNVCNTNLLPLHLSLSLLLSFSSLLSSSLVCFSYSFSPLFPLLSLFPFLLLFSFSFLSSLLRSSGWGLDMRRNSEDSTKTRIALRKRSDSSLGMKR